MKAYSWSRVRENFKHGSTRGLMITKLKRIRNYEIYLPLFNHGNALIENPEVQSISLKLTMWRIYAPTNMLSNLAPFHLVKYDNKCEVSVNPAAADANALIAAIKSCDTTGAVVR